MKHGFHSYQLSFMLALGSVMMLSAEDDIPLLRPEEKEVLRKQEGDFSKAITPILKAASRSTVRVWEKGQVEAGGYLAYGTVVGKGNQVLSKWSELRSVAPTRLLLQAADGRAIAARIVSVYADQDLALLEFEGEALTPVQWTDEQPLLGSFMAATQPDGQLAGFGVMSVRERSLRDADMAFLGVVGDIAFAGPGVRVREVSEGSGAAVAGIRFEDIILQVGQRPISGLMELRNALLPHQPGEMVVLKIQRQQTVLDVEVTLGNRPEYPNIVGARLRQMEQMGTDISAVRDSFSNVIQSDMSLQPNQMGGPVVNLKGEVLGLTLARADRTRTFVMSAHAVGKLLEQEGEEPAVAMAELREQMLAQRQVVRERMQQARPRPRQTPPEQLERHLGQMRRLMRLMEREMEALER